MRKKFLKVGNLKVEIPQEPQTTQQLTLQDSTSEGITANEPVQKETEEIKETSPKNKQNNTIYYLGGVAAALIFFLAVFAFLNHHSSQKNAVEKKNISKPIITLNRKSNDIHVVKTKKPVVVAISKPKKIVPTTTTITTTTTTTTTTPAAVVPVRQITRTTPAPTTTIKPKPVQSSPIHLSVGVTNVSSGKSSHVVSFQVSTVNNQGVVPYQKITISSSSCSPSQITGETGIDGEFNTTVVCHNPSGILATVSSDNQSEIVNSSW